MVTRLPLEEDTLGSSPSPAANFDTPPARGRLSKLISGLLDSNLKGVWGRNVPHVIGVVSEGELGEPERRRGRAPKGERACERLVLGRIATGVLARQPSFAVPKL